MIKTRRLREKRPLGFFSGESIDFIGLVEEGGFRGSFSLLAKRHSLRSETAGIYFWREGQTAWLGRTGGGRGDVKEVGGLLLSFGDLLKRFGGLDSLLFELQLPGFVSFNLDIQLDLINLSFHIKQHERGSSHESYDSFCEVNEECFHGT